MESSAYIDYCEKLPFTAKTLLLTINCAMISNIANVEFSLLAFSILGDLDISADCIRPILSEVNAFIRFMSDKLAQGRQISFVNTRFKKFTTQVENAFIDEEFIDSRLNLDIWRKWAIDVGFNDCSSAAFREAVSLIHDKGFRSPRDLMDIPFSVFKDICPADNIAGVFVQRIWSTISKASYCDKYCLPGVARISTALAQRTVELMRNKKLPCLPEDKSLSDALSIASIAKLRPIQVSYALNQSQSRSFLYPTLVESLDRITANRIITDFSSAGVYASGLAALISFVEALKFKYLPPPEPVAAAFLLTFRNSSTVKTYVAGIAKGFAHMGISMDVFSSQRCRHIYGSIGSSTIHVDRAFMVYDDFVLIYSYLNELQTISSQLRGQLCLALAISWMFHLRAGDECLHITTGFSGESPHDECMSRKGVIFQWKDRLFVRLLSRKNIKRRLNIGHLISRCCCCDDFRSTVETSCHGTNWCCPIHAIGRSIASLPPNTALFPDVQYKTLLHHIKAAAIALGLFPNRKIGLHAIRRGATEQIRREGGSLATLLEAGNWSEKSSSVLRYITCDDAISNSLSTNTCMQVIAANSESDEE